MPRYRYEREVLRLFIETWEVEADSEEDVDWQYGDDGELIDEQDMGIVETNLIVLTFTEVEDDE